MENEEKKASGGNKTLPIIIVIAVVVIGAGAYMLFGRSKSAVPTDSITVSTETTDTSVSETFSGTLKEAISLGVGMKCTYNVGGYEYEGYIKGENYRGKMMTAEGKTGTVIVKDDCMWTWEEGDTEGLKICYTETETVEGEEVNGEGGVWDQPSAAGSGVDYNCVPAAVSDAQFTPPATVNFLDPTEMIEGMGY